MAADGSVSNRRHIGRAAFERGIPDGMCVDADGNLWVAHVGGRRVVKLSPAGDELDEIPVPAKAVTSVAFGGPDGADLYIVTADNLDDPAGGAACSAAGPASPASDAAGPGLTGADRRPHLRPPRPPHEIAASCSGSPSRRADSGAADWRRQRPPRSCPTSSRA